MLILTAALAAATGARGGEAEEPPARLPEVLVTASRREAEPFDVPYATTVFGEWDIQTRRMARSLPEVLRDEPTVMVQKTSRGQGSPFLRGFTGFRTLMLIDGIRLNNSVFRDGPNQYWGTVDPFTVSRLEVVRGPGSVLYGSDAVGGTVNAVSRRREEFPDGFHWRRRVVYRYGTADDSHVGRVEIEGNWNHTLGFLLGTSLKDFDDLEAGHGVGTMPRTGYDERNRDALIEYFLDAHNKFVLGYQEYHQDDAWRAHKTLHGISWHGTSVGDERGRVLDQDRRLVYLQYHGRDLGCFFDAASVSLSYHVQEEERFRVRGDGRSDLQGFAVRTVGLGTEFQSDTPLGLLTYGADFYRDSVHSYATRYKANGLLDSVEIQGPVADDATYDLLGVYVQDEFPIVSRLDAILGLRYNYAQADADSVKDPDTGERISVKDDWDAVVASGRLLYRASDHWRLFGGLSQGFRAPNLSDLTRLDTARSNEIETPSPGLDPERFLSAELGAKARYDRWEGEVAVFRTRIRDLIIRYPTGRTVQGDAEVRKANVGDGYVHGVELRGSTALTEQWSLLGALAWQRGEVDTYPTSAKEKEREPMSRIPPLTGVLGLRWEHPTGRTWFEALGRLADEQDRLSPRDEGDTQRIPPGGTPGYGVFDLRGGMRLSENLRISAALENVFDKDYRIHGSGQNEPGRHFLVTLDWRF
ncbi:MAG: TonB-dependent receptor [Candidatus Brocadiia bacterium]